MRTANFRPAGFDDVCQGMVRTVARSLGGTVLLAHPESTAMREFYAGVAAVDGIELKTCPFPGDLALFGIRLLEGIGLRPPRCGPRRPNRCIRKRRYAPFPSSRPRTR